MLWKNANCDPAVNLDSDRPCDIHFAENKLDASVLLSTRELTPWCSHLPEALKGFLSPQAAQVFPQAGRLSFFNT